MADDPFAGSVLKIKRAYRHIQELEACVQAFLKSDFCSIRVDEDPATGHHVLRFSVTKPLPDEIPLSIGDATHNLRSALDILMCSIITRAGGNMARGNFPMHETRENLADALEKGEIKRVRPDLVGFILDTIKPYKLGNFGIWALNKLDIVDKHRLVIPVFAVTRLSGISARDDNNNTFTNLTVTVGPGGNINLISTGAKMHITNYGQPAIAIMFDKGHPFKGEAVIPKLRELAELTAGVVEAFRAVAT